MITLTKLNKEPFVLNHNQIQLMESIPETKIVMMNGEFFLVRESTEEVISRIINFQARIYAESGVTLVKKTREVRD